MTLKEVLVKGTECLKTAGILEADIDAWYLLSEIFQIERADYYLCQDNKADEDKLKLFEEAVAKRKSHIPLQYITGYQEFMGYRFKVNENVLIPRLDTEILVDKVSNVADGKNILDMCTGSGCIAITLGLIAKPQSITAADISAKALKVAEYNASYNEVNVSFIQSDMFENITDRYDIIVSNPPYIITDEIIGLDKEVASHEPFNALDGGSDGLVFYRILAQESKTYLQNDGLLALEIGCFQADDVKKILLDTGFGKVDIFKDFAGKDRVVFAKY